jgi:hypothetical protein
MTDSDKPQTKQNSVSGCLVKSLWMLVGNGALFFLAVLIAQHEPLKLSFRDAAFWSVVILMVAARFVDIWYLDGVTTEGEPATQSDWRRYVAVLLCGAAAVWLVAHGLAATGWLG